MLICFSFSLSDHEQQKPLINDQKGRKGWPYLKERKQKIYLNQQNTTEPAEHKDDQLPPFQGPKFSKKLET